MTHSNLLQYHSQPEACLCPPHNASVPCIVIQNFSVTNGPLHAQKWSSLTKDGVDGVLIKETEMSYRCTVTFKITEDNSVPENECGDIILVYSTR